MKRFHAIGRRSSLLVLCISTMVMLLSPRVESSPPSAVTETAGSEEPSASEESAADTEVSFEHDLLPVLVWRCGYCHMREDRHGSLIIDPELAYRSLVNVPAVSFAQMKRVEPGKPERSFLIYKMTGEHGRLGAAGRSMPSWPLPEEFIDLLRQWIAQGAKDN